VRPPPISNAICTLKAVFSHLSSISVRRDRGEERDMLQQRPTTAALELEFDGMFDAFQVE
jgi:hypothetical protein